jgi:hypothetical protein
VSNRDTADARSNSGTADARSNSDGEAAELDASDSNLPEKPDESVKAALSAQAILDQMGGVSGLIYSSLPVVVFVPLSSFFGLMPAIYGALGVATLILLWRVFRRESLQPAFSGFFAVGVSALIAYMVGESKGYFLLGIWTSLVYAGVFAVSIVIRRPLATSGVGSADTIEDGGGSVGRSSHSTLRRSRGYWSSGHDSSCNTTSTTRTRPAGLALRASRWDGR